MNIFYNILVAIICLILGYVLGSANISIPLGKMIFKQDPRDYGSHNCGATNCGRIWGKKYFFIVFFFDVIKTIISLYICWAILTYVPFTNGHGLIPKAIEMYTFTDAQMADYIIKWPVYWVAAVGAAFGNVFPLFTQFRGGKAASTYIGLTITTSWAFAVLGAITYFSCLLKTKYVSLSSIICGICNVIFHWTWALLLMFHVIPENFLFVINWAPILYCNYVYAIVMTIQVAIMIARHRSNIARLKAGTENEFHWWKKPKAKQEKSKEQVEK